MDRSINRLSTFYISIYEKVIKIATTIYKIPNVYYFYCRSFIQILPQHQRMQRCRRMQSNPLKLVRRKKGSLLSPLLSCALCSRRHKRFMSLDEREKRLWDQNQMETAAQLKINDGWLDWSLREMENTHILVFKCRNRVKIRNYNMREICVLMHADVGNTHRRRGERLVSGVCCSTNFNFRVEYINRFSRRGSKISLWSTRQTVGEWELWVQSNDLVYIYYIYLYT